VKVAGPQHPPPAQQLDALAASPEAFAESADHEPVVAMRA